MQGMETRKSENWRKRRQRNEKREKRKKEKRKAKRKKEGESMEGQQRIYFETALELSNSRLVSSYPLPYAFLSCRPARAILPSYAFCAIGSFAIFAIVLRIRYTTPGTDLLRDCPRTLRQPPRILLPAYAFFSHRRTHSALSSYATISIVLRISYAPPGTEIR
eukprot:3149197-Rhodomonas_salina.1